MVFFLCSCKGHYEVLNRGFAGNNSTQLLQRIQRDVVAASPDLILILVGTNDMINSKKFLSYDSYLSNLQNIIRILKSESRPKSY